MPAFHYAGTAKLGSKMSLGLDEAVNADLKVCQADPLGPAPHLLRRTENICFLTLLLPLLNNTSVEQ